MKTDSFELPAPSFRLTWNGERGAYYVDKPNIESTDCYTPADVRTAISAHIARQGAEPVARLHITATDSYPVVEVEVLDGSKLQPSMSPVNVYLAAPLEAQADSTPLLPVLRIRSWTKNGEGHGDLVDWLEGSENLPDGEYDLYLGPQSGQKPVASIYISPNGEREFDDWKHDLPIGRNELYAAPVAQAALPKRYVLMVTTAYEQGVGKGRQAFDRKTEIANPYGDKPCHEAWGMGYNEGKDQASRLAAPVAQPATEINHLEQIYGFLCSIAPEGIADEAFRNVPEALLADSVRHRIAGSRPSVGENSRAVPEHVGSSASAGGRDGEAVSTQPATEAVPDGYQLVMVPKLAPDDEPDWDECIRQSEEATGIKVERGTLSIVIREVRRWLAHRATLPPASNAEGRDHDTEAGEAQAVLSEIRASARALAAIPADRLQQECDTIAELNHAQWLALGKASLLVAACNRLSAESEEFDFDDGMGRGVQQAYWDEFEGALEQTAEAIDEANKTTQRIHATTPTAPAQDAQGEAAELLDWFVEAGGFNQGTKAPHKWVLRVEQELRRLAALRASSPADRIEADEALMRTAVVALEQANNFVTLDSVEAVITALRKRLESSNAS